MQTPVAIANANELAAGTVIENFDGEYVRIVPREPQDKTTVYASDESNGRIRFLTCPA